MELTYVTKPYLPNIEEVIPLFKDIWDSRVLTNGGKYHTALEQQLKELLDLNCINLCNNGHSGLQIAIETLQLSGEVITTPFTFVSTTHAIKNCNLIPVFADIDPLTLGIDPDRLEESITENTSAILATHVYGRPCKVDEINKIAEKYNLKVIYDACHAFGAEYNGKSLLTYGDISVVSFHATKLFNTLEGGAVISNKVDRYDTINCYKNFGIDKDGEIKLTGFNGKLNEISAAIGLCQINHIDHVIESRKSISLQYDSIMSKYPHIVQNLGKIPGHNENHSYYPVKAKDNTTRQAIIDKLNKHGILARKYFYPLTSDVEIYKNEKEKSGSLPIAEECAQRIFCLPLFPGLNENIITIVDNTLKDIS